MMMEEARKKIANRTKGKQKSEIEGTVCTVKVYYEITKAEITHTVYYTVNKIRVKNIYK